MRDEIYYIHQQLVNGNRQDMVRMIDDYGLYDFWDDYERFLFELYDSVCDRYGYIVDAVKSYHRIKNR